MEELLKKYCETGGLNYYYYQTGFFHLVFIFIRPIENDGDMVECRHQDKELYTFTDKDRLKKFLWSLNIID